ncbi:preprotein translocase subunit YajC [Arachnia propionica]|uniref:Preprotein translocase subunit YajC n=1 Tax=Arachnia propionica TaxID=1750 RepID=A0A3P1TD47_9ACTN|nr:preprotein translocase subunit YajC [Arachnia propionica]RRD07218.1 preprotein translocase subunit YajC [Arachnia propionica]
MLETLLMIVAFGGLMYFMMVRPQQRKMREHQAVIDALQPGARVLVQSGLYGTLTHVGDKQVIIEFAPGLEVTCLKAAILREVAEDEEEFEFDDETGPVPTVESTEVSELTEETASLDEVPEKN